MSRRAMSAPLGKSQPGAAVAGGQPEHRDLVPGVVAGARDHQLQHRGGPGPGDLATNASVASGKGRPTVMSQSRSRPAIRPGSSSSQAAAPAANALFLTTSGTS